VKTIPQRIVVLTDDPDYVPQIESPNKTTRNSKIKYVIQGIPFTSASKYNHTLYQDGCCAMLSESDAIKLTADMMQSMKKLDAEDANNRADSSMPLDIFCTDCGHLHKAQNNPTAVSCERCGTNLPSMFDSERTATFSAPITGKRWYDVTIVSECYDKDNNKYKQTDTLTIFHNYDSAASVALKQYIKPDDFKRILSTKVWGRDPMLDSFQTACYPPPA